jgi:hypothetical protein
MPGIGTRLSELDPGSDQIGNGARKPKGLRAFLFLDSAVARTQGSARNKRKNDEHHNKSNQD